MTTPESVFVSSVTGCARCGGYHQQIEFIAFKRPIEDDNGRIWGYWGTCPTTGDPILLTKMIIYDVNKEEQTT